MTTRKKTSTRKTTRPQPPNGGAVDPEAANRAARAAIAKQLDGATGMHMTYHPERGIIRLNVAEDIKVAGETQRHGRDVDIALEHLDSDIRAAIVDAFTWLCEDNNATPFEP